VTRHKNAGWISWDTDVKLCTLQGKEVYSDEINANKLREP
jgi:hypothetical protein